MQDGDLTYPLNQITFLAGEKLLWSKGQGTFHRSYDWCFAVTDRRALIFYKVGVFRTPQWIDFSLTEIKQIKITDSPYFTPFFWSKWIFKTNNFPLTKLILTTNNQQFIFKSVWDDYQDERVFDRNLVLEWADELAKQGINVILNAI